MKNSNQYRKRFVFSQSDSIVCKRYKPKKAPPKGIFQQCFVNLYTNNLVQEIQYYKYYTLVRLSLREWPKVDQGEIK